MLKLKSSEEMLELSQSIINATRDPLITLDKYLRVVTANHSFYQFFKLKPEKTIGQLMIDLDNKQWRIPALSELLDSVLTRKTSTDNFMIEHNFAGIGHRVMSINARQVEQTEGKELIILLVMQDITERSGELVLANIEKDKRAVELVIANEEKNRLTAELVIVNKQKKVLVDELVIANEELSFQNSEKDKRAEELVIANEELGFQSSEKDKRAAELVIANEELAFQNSEKNKRAAELVIANEEKAKQAAELVIVTQKKNKRVANASSQVQEGSMMTDASAITAGVNDIFSQITGCTPENALGKNA